MLNRTYMTMLYNGDIYKIYFTINKYANIEGRIYLDGINIESFLTSVTFDIDFIMEIVLDRLKAVIGGI